MSDTSQLKEHPDVFNCCKKVVSSRNTIKDDIGYGFFNATICLY